MNPCRLLLFLALALALGRPAARAADGTAVAPRLQMDLDANWRFYPGEALGAEAPAYDDAAWTAVSLPHTWNARDGEDGGNNYRRGPGWYRRHLRLGPQFAGRRLYLQFDGASLKAEVWVNGHRLGAHLGGFARFRFDATGALQLTGDNIIAVRVDNGQLGIPPVRADFTFFGGLYRGVSLLVTDPVQISTLDYASPGVYLTPRHVTRESSEVEIRTLLENHGDQAQAVTVSATIRDASGNPVGTASAESLLAAGGSGRAVESIELPHPHLWDGRADPYLYRVRVELRTASGLRDVVEQPLGLRFYRVDPSRGFILNGHYLDLHGVNRHQDRIDKGWAISEADEAQDFALIRDLGCTAIRVSHYQQSETWYERCDRSGIIAWAEVPFVDDALPTKLFSDSAVQQLRELIRQNYNHPAICFWSVGNETSGPADPVLAREAAVARAEDPTRPSTYASNALGDNSKNWHTRVVAFNRYFGWYRGTVSDFGPEIDAIHAAHPLQPIGISEYGAGASIYQHEDPPRQPAAPRGPFHPEEWQNVLHEATWAAMEQRPYLWCKFVWCMFDFASDGRNEGDHPGRNDKGLVTYDRKTRKDAYFFYQANWSDLPVLHITSASFTQRIEPQTEIKVYSNAPEVEVRLNGVSLGSHRGTDHVFVWVPVTLAPGVNRIEASGEVNGARMTDQCTWLLASGQYEGVPSPR